MKKSKFSEEQIAHALREVESGRPPADLCRRKQPIETAGRGPRARQAHARGGVEKKV
jgi:hypothetical protein